MEVENLHYILNDKSAIHRNKHYYTEIEQSCMALQFNWTTLVSNQKKNLHETAKGETNKLSKTISLKNLFLSFI